MKISKVHARQILDSRGVPTIEVDAQLEDGTKSRAAVPSGASTGAHEAVEIVALKAVSNVNEKIAPEIIGFDSNNQQQIDQKLIDLDGTENKSNLGANAILGISMAICKAAALSQKKSLYSYIGQLCGNTVFHLPRPMILLLEGGKHGNWSTDIQEFMIMPEIDRFGNFTEALTAASKINSSLQQILKIKNYSTGIGLEGAYCPKELSSNDEAFELIIEAISKADFESGRDFVLAIDVASSEFYRDGKYVLKSEDNEEYDSVEWSQKIISWIKTYPIFSLEDVFEQDEWTDWSKLFSEIGADHQIVGDDLTTTNVKRIKKAIEEKAINAVIIKPNQIGTVSETIEAVKLTKSAGFKSIVSHRAGETNDDFIADFAVGSGSEQCKFGGISRGERLAKYNQLLRIEEQIKSG